MRKQKVAIIGAGPSGFAVAEVLRSDKFKDFFEFTIFERNSYVGGKCLTVMEDGTVSNDKPGGYEVGAVLMSKHAPSYSRLKEIIEDSGIETSPHAEKERKMSTYYKDGKQAEVRQLYWSQLITKPRAFFRAFHGFDEYGSDYVRYIHTKNAGYTGRPRALYKSLSKKYSRVVYSRLATVVQAFGYADLNDKHLTPATLYYHQYVEPDSVIFPIHKIENGMQSIWIRLAKKYDHGAVRLNQQVKHVARSPLGVSVTTSKLTEEFDHLVVATPLKPALSYLDLGKLDRNFMSKMKHNHYVTVMCRIPEFKTIASYNLPGCTEKKRIGEVMLGYKRYPNSEVVTAYLFIKKGHKSDDKTILDLVEKSLKKDFNATLANRKSAKIYHWDDYFGHLDTKDLDDGWYEKFDKNIQGKNRTLFVSSGLHMETVGASVQYGDREAKKYFKQYI